MAESQHRQHASHSMASQGQPNASRPLGIENPLLPHQGLGQHIPHLQFMRPLGAQPLTVLDPSVFVADLHHPIAETQAAFDDTPFFQPDTSRTEPASPPTLQRQSIATPPLPPSSDLPAPPSGEPPTNSVTVPATTLAERSRSFLRLPKGESQNPTKLSPNSGGEAIALTGMTPLTPTTPLRGELPNSFSSFALDEHALDKHASRPFLPTPANTPAIQTSTDAQQPAPAPTGTRLSAAEHQASEEFSEPTATPEDCTTGPAPLHQLPASPSDSPSDLQHQSSDRIAATPLRPSPTPPSPAQPPATDLPSVQLQSSDAPTPLDHLTSSTSEKETVQHKATAQPDAVQPDATQTEGISEPTPRTPPHPQPSSSGESSLGLLSESASELRSKLPSESLSESPSESLSESPSEPSTIQPLSTSASLQRVIAPPVSPSTAPNPIAPSVLPPTPPDSNAPPTPPSTEAIAPSSDLQASSDPDTFNHQQEARQNLPEPHLSQSASSSAEPSPQPDNTPPTSPTEQLIQRAPDDAAPPNVQHAHLPSLTHTPAAEVSKPSPALPESSSETTIRPDTSRSDTSLVESLESDHALDRAPDNSIQQKQEDATSIESSQGGKAPETLLTTLSEGLSDALVGRSPQSLPDTIPQFSRESPSRPDPNPTATTDAHESTSNTSESNHTSESKPPLQLKPESNTTPATPQSVSEPEDKLETFDPNLPDSRSMAMPSPSENISSNPRHPLQRRAASDQPPSDSPDAQFAAPPTLPSSDDAPRIATPTAENGSTVPPIHTQADHPPASQPHSPQNSEVTVQPRFEPDHPSTQTESSSTLSPQEKSSQAKIQPKVDKTEPSPLTDRAGNDTPTVNTAHPRTSDTAPPAQSPNVSSILSPNLEAPLAPAERPSHPTQETSVALPSLQRQGIRHQEVQRQDAQRQDIQPSVPLNSRSSGSAEPIGAKNKGVSATSPAVSPTVEPTHSPTAHSPIQHQIQAKASLTSSSASPLQTSGESASSPNVQNASDSLVPSPSAHPSPTYPALPQVLQNLTTLIPLGHSHSLQAKHDDHALEGLPNATAIAHPPTPQPTTSASPATPQNSTPDSRPAPMPNQWANLTDLLQQSPSSISTPTPTPTPLSPSLPPLSPFSSPQTSLQPKHVSNPQPKPLASLSPNVIQKFSDPALPSPEPPSEHPNTQSPETPDENKPAASPEKVEELARVIYQLVRQRLMIERERFGGHSSGRLPW